METHFSHLHIPGEETNRTANIRGAAGPQSQAQAAVTRDASLDDLPAELKALILLSCSDILSLRTLVRSSPLYHEVYLGERQAILSAVLLRDIGTDVMSDALAVYKASQLEFDELRKQSVETFIAQYKAERWTFCQDSYDSLDITTLRSLSRLHIMVLKIAVDFCEMTLSCHPATGERIKSYKNLSVNEKRRVQRALYRFELFCTLFRSPSHREVTNIDREFHSPFDAMDQNFLFLHIFKTWEIEELACVHEYIYGRHAEFLQESNSELSKIYPNKEFGFGLWPDDNKGHFESLGLSFLYQLLNTSTAVQKATILQHELGYHPDFLADALKEGPYDEVYYTEVYQATEAGQELLFKGDSLVDGPNAAWPWSTFQRATVYYFEGHKQPFRKWAYVMWDFDRLQDWGILDTDPKRFFNKGYHIRSWVPDSCLDGD